MYTVKKALAFILVAAFLSANLGFISTCWAMDYLNRIAKNISNKFTQEKENSPLEAFFKTIETELQEFFFTDKKPIKITDYNKEEASQELARIAEKSGRFAQVLQSSIPYTIQQACASLSDFISKELTVQQLQDVINNISKSIAQLKKDAPSVADTLQNVSNLIFESGNNKIEYAYFNAVIFEFNNLGNYLEANNLDNIMGSTNNFLNTDKNIKNYISNSLNTMIEQCKAMGEQLNNKNLQILADTLFNIASTIKYDISDVGYKNLIDSIKNQLQFLHNIFPELAVTIDRVWNGISEKRLNEKQIKGQQEQLSLEQSTSSQRLIGNFYKDDVTNLQKQLKDALQLYRYATTKLTLQTLDHIHRLLAESITKCINDIKTAHISVDYSYFTNFLWQAENSPINRDFYADVDTGAEDLRKNFNLYAHLLQTIDEDYYNRVHGVMQKSY